MKPRPYLKSIEFRDSADIDRTHFPFTIPAVNGLDQVEFHADVTFLVGENGSGKSTVLEAIACALGFGAEGGTMNIQMETVSTNTGLADHLRLIKSYKRPRDGFFLRAESFYNVASYMDEVGYLAGYGNKSLHARSHGEAFMSLLVDKLRGNGLYLLDEPEAALSPSSLMKAIVAIDRLVRKESQFIIATHSPILLAYPRAKILRFSESGIATIAYEDTEHFVLTKDFLNNHPKRIKQLLDAQ